MHGFPVVSEQKQITLKGGIDGSDFYRLIYGANLPDGTGYDPANDVVYELSSGGGVSAPTPNYWQAFYDGFMNGITGGAYGYSEAIDGKTPYQRWLE